jgi:hypothetical protein
LIYAIVQSARYLEKELSTFSEIRFERGPSGQKPGENESASAVNFQLAQSKCGRIGTDCRKVLASRDSRRHTLIVVGPPVVRANQLSVSTEIFVDSRVPVAARVDERPELPTAVLNDHIVTGDRGTYVVIWPGQFIRNSDEGPGSREYARLLDLEDRGITIVLR